MHSDDDKDGITALESRLAHLVGLVEAAGESLGEIPESLTPEWLDEQEARWTTRSVDSPSEEVDRTDSTESSLSTAAEASDVSTESKPSSPPQEEPRTSQDLAVRVFLPNRAEWIAFGAYAVAGAMWSGVLALELVHRESVDGIRGVIVLSFLSSVILGFVVRREFHRPQDLSGSQGETRYVREGLTLGLAGLLGTAAGVGLGLGTSDTELGSVIGWGDSMGSGLVAFVVAWVLYTALNGALRHGGGDRSIAGFGIWAVLGTGLLAAGVLHIQEIVGLVDSFADAQEQAEQFLDDAVGDKADMPKHSADWVTTLAVSPLPDLCRVVLRQLYVFNLAVTALFLGLGSWLLARLMWTADWPKRLGRSITASRVVGYGLLWLSAALSLGTLMALDAAFLQVGSGPNEMKSEVTVLLGVLLITAGSGVSSGVRHLAAGRRHLKKRL